MPRDRRSPIRLFASLPPAYLSRAIAGPIATLFLQQGGTRTTLTHSSSTHASFQHDQTCIAAQAPQAMLYFVDPPTDPAIVHLYIATVVLYNARWIVDSFRADKLLDLQDYIVFPWDYTGDPARIPRSLFRWHPSVSKLFRDFNVVIIPDGRPRGRGEEPGKKRRVHGRVNDLQVQVKREEEVERLSTPLSIGQEKRFKAPGHRGHTLDH